MRLLDTINEIIELAEIGDYFGRNDISIRSFGLGQNVINFINQNALKYSDAIARAYSSDTEISGSYTLKKYESLLIGHFREIMLQGGSAKQTDVDAFRNNLILEPKQVFSVFRDILPS